MQEINMRIQKNNFTEFDIQLLYRLELGNTPANFAAATIALDEKGLDFVIGVIHNTSLELNEVISC